MTPGQRRIRRTLTSIDWGAVVRFLAICTIIPLVTFLLALVLP